MLIRSARVCEQNEKRSSRVQKETPQKPATTRPRPGKFFSPAGEGTSFSARSFAELKISRPLIKACEALGYSKPTPIQVPPDLQSLICATSNKYGGCSGFMFRVWGFKIVGVTRMMVHLRRVCLHFSALTIRWFGFGLLDRLPASHWLSLGGTYAEVP